MSHRHVMDALARDLPDDLKIVLVTIATHTDAFGHSWLSLASLATLCRKPPQQLVTLVARLIRRGLLESGPRREGGPVHTVLETRVEPKAETPTLRRFAA